MKINSITKISVSLVSLCVTAVVTSNIAGLIPDERATKARERASLCETLSSGVTFLVGKREFRQAEFQLELFAKRNPDLIAAGIRAADGRLVAQARDHQSAWSKGLSNQNDGCYVVPIQSKDGRWGSIELQFPPIYVGMNRYFSTSVLKLLALLVPLVGIACYWQLSRILRYLDPSRVVPQRVRQTLDSFAEGVVLLDDQDRIVLANDVFADYLPGTAEDLIGKCLWDLSWDFGASDDEMAKSIQSRLRAEGAISGTTMKLTDRDGKLVAVFSMNATAVRNDDGGYQGLMAAFADVTPLERNRAALASTLDELRKSKTAISKQNEELRYLATRDSLTSCLNRRTFFDLFATHWDEAKAKGTPLSAMMIDIDFFKNVNDQHGHAAGDEVLRQTGALLSSMAREEDVVCRYGGEEFSILMPGLDVAEAEWFAERIRAEMSQLKFQEFSITASLGVSEINLGAADPQDLLNQADQCLYVAKRQGRNQVVRFDLVPEEALNDETAVSRSKIDGSDSTVSIPFQAVTALLSALTYRDSQTGTHSIRVSGYSVLLAQQVLGPRDTHVVEIAALLHDIGKIGIPDSILLKPGKLTADEWKQMERHDHIGIEIIKSSFKHEGLTSIIRNHHAKYDGTGAGGLAGNEIPIGARILTIADSFDAMVSDRPYRKGMPVADAIEELRRCAGTQFDPTLVEMFVGLIEEGAAPLPSGDKANHSNDVILNIGEQVVSLVEAADVGDSKAFVALAERLRQTAEQANVQTVATAASKAIEVVDENAEFEKLVEESFELLAVCQSLKDSGQSEELSDEFYEQFGPM